MRDTRSGSRYDGRIKAEKEAAKRAYKGATQDISIDGQGNPLPETV
jgi:hypothetical protein